MIQKFYNLNINTNGQKLYEFTDQSIQWISKSNFKNGMLNLSIQHTSASLIIQENADPDVQKDLINYFDKLVTMDNNLYIHNIEGKDDKNNINKVLIYPEKSKSMNLAFDITPAKYVTGLITEKGVCEASTNGLKKMFKQ